MLLNEHNAAFSPQARLIDALVGWITVWLVDRHSEPVRRPKKLSQNAVDEFAKDVAEMVADHAPRMFAVVLEYREQVDARIVAWGMELDEGAYMTTVDGRRQFALAETEGALRYIRGNPDTTPRLVWVGPAES